MKIKFVALGAFLMACVLLLMAAAPPAAIQRNQFSTNIVGVLVKGAVGFDSTVNITGEADIGGTLIVTNVVQANNVVITNNGTLIFATNGTGPDTFLVRDNTPNILAMRTNGAVSQAFRVYSSFTDSANNEFLNISASTSFNGLVSTKNGSGTARQLIFQGSSSSASITLGGTSGALNIDTAGNLFAGNDATYNIGATNATRWKTIYLARGLVLGPNTDGGFLTNILTGRAILDFPSTGPVKASDLTITVTGVTTNDTVMLGVPPVCAITNTSYFAFPSNDTVWVRFLNHDTNTSQNPGPGSFSVLVNRF